MYLADLSNPQIHVFCIYETTRIFVEEMTIFLPLLHCTLFASNIQVPVCIAHC
jgi:hypothetical protein